VLTKDERVQCGERRECRRGGGAGRRWVADKLRVEGIHQAWEEEGERGLRVGHVGYGEEQGKESDHFSSKRRPWERTRLTSFYGCCTTTAPRKTGTTGKRTKNASESRNVTKHGYENSNPSKRERNRNCAAVPRYI
jgi:hypothetical protein